MKWILRKTKIEEKDFENIEANLGIKFPLDFRNIVLENNGASPEKMVFDTIDSKERVAEYLLSFSKDDKDNIMDVCNYMLKNDYIPNRFNGKLIPIMKDPFGNYICFDFAKDNEICLYFWNHENNNLEYVSKTFSEFLNNLYE